MKRLFLSIGFCIALVSAYGQTVPLLRISIENSKDHIQTKVVTQFANLVNERLQGRLEAICYYDARLFRDNVVLNAISQGKVEMAVPGIWNAESFDSNFAIFLLPFLYGASAADNHALADGFLGNAIKTNLEQSYPFKVLGRWIDLGHAHIFTVKKKIGRYEDLAGLRIRVAGGKGNEFRLAALGASPTTIPWSDLPTKLSIGAVDGILTTYETVLSGKLWNNGISYAFEDSEYFPMYIPIVSAVFFQRLPADVQKELVEIWESIVDDARKAAAEAQAEAKKILQNKGIIIVKPEPDHIRRIFEQLMQREAEIADKLKVDPVLHKAARAGVLHD